MALKNVNDTAAYAVQATDKLLVIQAAGSYDYLRLAQEYSTDGQKTWTHANVLLPGSNGSPISGNVIEAFKSQTAYAALDLTQYPGTTHVRSRVEQIQGTSPSATAAFTGQAWTATSAAKQNAPGNVDGSLLNLPSAPQSASGNSGPINVGSDYKVLLAAANVTALAGTSPTVQFFVDYLGADGIWYNVWSSSSINAAGTATQSIGTGLETSKRFSHVVRLRWVLGGTNPVVTFSASLIGLAS